MTPAPEGILLVNKEAGMTSADVVSRVRQLSGVRRVGHTGTLDPFATGVLPVCLGRATAASAYMLKWNKRYLCDIRLGYATDTMDAQGSVREVAPDPALWRCFQGENRDSAIETLKEAVVALTAVTSQQAPLYSAVKVRGKPLYRYAREGRDVQRPFRPVTVYESVYRDVRDDEKGFPLVSVEFLVGAGTYIRALADTLGRKLGCFAHAASLQRLSAGHFDLLSSHRLDRLAQEENVFQFVRPVGDAFTGWPRLNLTGEEAGHLAHGRVIPFPEDRITVADADAGRLAPPPGDRWIACVFEGRLVAVGVVEDSVCRARRVFMTPEEL